MKMKCPHCGVSGKADVALSGRKVKCPKCTNFFLVPVIAEITPVTESDLPDPAVSSEDSVPDLLSGKDGQPVISEESFPDSETDGVEDEAKEVEADSSDLSEEEEPDVADKVEQRTDEASSRLEDTGNLSSASNEEQEQELTPVGEDIEANETDEEITPVQIDSPENDDSAGFFDDLSDGIDNTEITEEDLLPEENAAPLVEEDELEPAEQDVLVETSGAKEDEFSHFSDDEVAWEDDKEKVSAESEAVSDLPEVAEQELHAELEAELEAMLAGTCSVCGKTIDNENVFNEDGHLYCGDCFNKDNGLTPEAEDGEGTSLATDLRDHPGEAADDGIVRKIPSFSFDGDFSAVTVLKEAWRMTKGIKGSIWGGIVVMLLILFGLGGATIMFLPAIGAPDGGTVTAWMNILIQLFSIILSMLFIAGLINIGVQRVADKNFSWKMIFSGFVKMSNIVIAGILMTLLITSGFFLLILPGIYLAVGYSLTLPLILDKGFGPWDAMEVSRRTIHRKWWHVFGIYLIMYLIYLVSCVPFGLGLIWTIPMFFTVSGVLYRLFFQEEVC